MNMKVARADIVGIAPLSFGAPVKTLRPTNKPADVFEEETWRERIHADKDGNVFLPAMALKYALEEVAKFQSERIPGKGKNTFTKHFKTGIMVVDNLMLNVKRDDVPGIRVFVPSDGKKGGGSRVWKIFPTLDEWNTSCVIYIMSPMLFDYHEKVHEYLKFAGDFNGMGTFAPRGGGYHGRYKVTNWTVEDAV